MSGRDYSPREGDGATGNFPGNDNNSNQARGNTQHEYNTSVFSVGGGGGGEESDHDHHSTPLESEVLKDVYIPVHTDPSSAAGAGRDPTAARRSNSAHASSHHHHNGGGGGGDGDEGSGEGESDGGAEEEDEERRWQLLEERYGRSFLQTSAVKTLPAHLLPLAHEIYNLDEEDLVHIASMADAEAAQGLYSLLPYTGSNWFLPHIQECGEGERHWGVAYAWPAGLTLTIAGRRLTVRLLNMAVRGAFLVLCWFMLWAALPHWLVLPGGYVWDPAVLVVVSAIVGGLLCRIIQIPPLVGVLWVGIMWNNIPHLHYLTAGIDKHVFDICSKMGLTVILARAGYSLSLRGILPHWKQSILLATLPFAFEGVAHSLIANKVFDYENDYNWAFLQGMLCSIVSPAVVVPGTLYLQELRYGRGVGPLSLMLSAVGVEIVIGVWCANFLIGLIFQQQKLAVAIVLGPVQFVGGVLIGIALGVLFHFIVELIKNEAQRLPNGKFQRQHFHGALDFAFFIMLFASYTMVFLGYRLNLAGGGCVMCVFFSVTVAHLWLTGGIRGGTRRRSELEEQKKYIGAWMAFVWDEAMLPILFATMGAKIDVLAIFNKDFFPKAIICMVCSTAVRMIVIFVVQIGDGMPWMQKLLVSVGYLGKASAQASVGPVAANLVTSMIAALPPGESPSPSLLRMQKYANYVQQMSAMYVMFMAPIASLGLVRGGMRILTRAPDPKAQQQQHHHHHNEEEEEEDREGDGNNNKDRQRERRDGSGASNEGDSPSSVAPLHRREASRAEAGEGGGVARHDSAGVSSFASSGKSKGPGKSREPHP